MEGLAEDSWFAGSSEAEKLVCGLQPSRLQQCSFRGAGKGLQRPSLKPGLSEAERLAAGGQMLICRWQAAWQVWGKVQTLAAGVCRRWADH